MNNYDYPFNRPGYWNGCVPPNENGTVIVRSANARDGEDANDEEDVSSLRNSPSESSLFFYHTDHLGSTNLVTDRGRSICHAAEYLPYGEVFLEIKGSYDHLGTPFKFNGKEMDPETGMLYYGARYYMPKYCQWPTCDPMELKYPHVSSYSFCHNNPINRIDDDGMDDYEIDNDGYMYNTTTWFEKIKAFLGYGKNQDRLFFKGQKKPFAVYPYGTVANLKKEGNKTSFEVADYRLASDLFKKIINSSHVEWARIVHSTNRSSEFVNNHKDDDVSRAIENLQLYEKKGEPVYLFEHSHPLLKELRIYGSNLHYSFPACSDDVKTALAHPKTTFRVYDTHNHVTYIFNYCCPIKM